MRGGLFLVCCLLAGCPASPPTPLDRPGGAAPNAAGIYRVQRGDTLYSIAFRHHVDWRDLALWNNIGPPHTIYPGQDLRLKAFTERPGTTRRDHETAGDRPVAVLQRPDVGEARDLPAIDLEPDVTAPDPEPAAEPEPVETPREDPPTPAERESAPPPEPEPEVAPESRAPSAPAPERNVAGVNWRWPTEGQLVRRFDASATRKGIGIAGDEGQSVVAAAAGNVVYSGTGLLGYGELIIIKHTDNLLSAYGHNRRRLVEEGDRVRAGQTIAEMGRNERNEIMLHFEIRNNGQPADPLGYVPRR